MEDRRKFTRRTLVKGMAACNLVLTGVPHLFSEEITQFHTLPHSRDWEQVFPGVWRITTGKPEAFSPVAARLVPAQIEAFKRLPHIAEAPLPPPSASLTQRGCTVVLPLRPKELIYGFGLQLLSLNQRGKKKVARVNADPKLDTGDSHAPVPFYVTTEGIGILIDTARYATFYFDDAHPAPNKQWRMSPNQNPDPNYTSNSRFADAGKVIVEIPRATGIDVYLFAGPTMLDAVRRYNVFSGGGFTPPEWGLGFWYRADAKATAETALSLATELRKRKIPCDVFGLEPGWQTHSYSCTFAWNPDRFPSPATFIQKMSSMEYKVNLWEHAFTHPASPLFEELRPLSGDYGVWGGLVPDFANVQARRAFSSYHERVFVDAGISGFKLDECDNSDYTGGWSFPELTQFSSGVDGEQMHSIFGLGYQKTIWDAFRKRNQSTYGLVRSSGALAAPFPFVLYSDLYNHREFVRALVNSGFSGLLWCPEVRDAASEEDLIRRLQNVVFSPLAMVNGWYIKSPPWHQLDRKLNNAGERMEDWEAVESRCREIIGWRMSLVPYLMAAFQRYAFDGTPPFRALALDTPGDENLHEVDDQYMVGDRMMVAPLFAGEASRLIVLPADTNWHDFWTGAPIPGGTKITVAASTENIPVYVKAGSIVPWADIGLHSGSPETRRITARIYGDGSLPFAFRSGTGVVRLSWHAGQGSATETNAKASSYEVYAWKQM